MAASRLKPASASISAGVAAKPLRASRWRASSDASAAAGPVKDTVAAKTRLLTKMRVECMGSASGVFPAYLREPEGFHLQLSMS